MPVKRIHRLLEVLQGAELLKRVWVYLPKWFLVGIKDSQHCQIVIEGGRLGYLSGEL
jgi:hypothetical protein